MKHTVSLLLILCALSVNALAQKNTNAATGQVLYKANCTSCHGADGTQGTYGAANLRRSLLDDVKLLKKISNGGWIMPAWKKSLSAEQIQLVLGYVKTLRN